MSPKKELLENFQCQNCGNCCRQDGYVRLKEDEIDRIAAFLNLSVEEFTKKYTRLTIDRQALSLIDKPDGACIFLETTGCSINPVKPEQCLDFPLKWKFKAFGDICAWAKKTKEHNQT